MAKAVLQIFLLVFTLSMLLILWNRYKEWKNYRNIIKNWPPNVNACPDYWVESVDKRQCKNINGTGTIGRNHIMNLSDYETNAQKCQFALSNQLNWEGVDNDC